MANGERSREAGPFHDHDQFDYMHNHRLTPQHLMPLGEEDDDGAILMLQGAQRSELFLFNLMQTQKGVSENLKVYVHPSRWHQ